MQKYYHDFLVMLATFNEYHRSFLTCGAQISYKTNTMGRSVEVGDLLKFSKRNKRSVSNDEETERSRLAGKIVNALASERKWKDDGMTWFTYANNNTAHENSTISIRLIIADRFKYEAVNNSSLLRKPENLSEILIKLSEDVLKGNIKLKIDGESVKIPRLNGCLDWNCEEHAFNITTLQQSNEAIGMAQSAPNNLYCFLFWFVYAFFNPL